MSLNAGDQITYCLVPGMQRFSATILSIDNDSIILRLNADSPSTLPPSQYTIISDADDDVDYHSEVVDKDGSTLRLKRMWTGKRGFFRVDDVFPVAYRKVSDGDHLLESRVYTIYGEESAGLGVPDETVSPRLWNLLVDMNTKLGMILEQLHLDSEGLTKADRITVNISASGIRFKSNVKFDAGDMVEVKMLLPTNPAAGILAYGRAVRVAEIVNGTYETSLHFVSLGDEVRDTIIHYTLKRQRDVVRRFREQDQSA